MSLATAPADRRCRLKLANLYYPKSMLKLLLIGFVVVSLPLVIALASAVASVQRLANHSEAAVDQAAQAARGSRQLMEQALSMERVVRQFLILDDRALLDDYGRMRTAFRHTTGELSRLPLDGRQRSALHRIVEREDALHGLLDESTDASDAPEREATLIAGYVDLSAAARGMAHDSTALIDREVDRMRDEAGAAQRSLLLQLLAAFPLGLLIAVLFAFLIARPIGQLERSIRRLGDGELGTAIRLEGPADLEYLGERLEWLRHRLIEIEEQKAMFLRHVSHELKTPLTALREGAELLADGTAGPLAPAQTDVVDIVRKNSVLLQQMIEDLLNYQRALAGVLNAQFAPVDLAGIVAGVIDSHRLAAARRALTIDVRTQPAPLQGDREKLRVVIDNLLSNAIKFSPDGGVIRIEVVPAGDAVQLDVVDQGPGIAAADRLRIFDWFFRGEREQSARVRGSGLGLAIAREFVLAHRGTITVVDGDGGAHLRVVLPIVAKVDHA